MATGAGIGAWVKRIGIALRFVETAFLTVLLLALVLIAFGQIVLRNVFSTGVAWADGSAQIIVLWIAVIGALAATGDGRHISINLAGRYLPPAWGRAAGVITDLFAAAVTGTFAWHAASFVADSREFGDQLLGSVPAWLMQSIIPAGFALIALRFAVNAGSRLARRG